MKDARIPVLTSGFFVVFFFSIKDEERYYAKGKIFLLSGFHHNTKVHVALDLYSNKSWFPFLPIAGREITRTLTWVIVTVLLCFYFQYCTL